MRYRHSITLQQPGGSRDSVGERVTSWTNVKAVYADISTLNMREQMLVAQRQASTTHKVTLRYDPDLAAINAAWRVLFGSRVLVIDGVNNVDERNKTLELLCTEGRNE